MARYNTIDPKVKIWLKEVFSNRELSCKIEENLYDGNNVLSDDQVKTERQRYHKIPDLENSITIPEGEQTSLYVGQATDLVLDLANNMVVGNPLLTKYVVIEKEEQYLQFWPPAIKVGPVVKRKKILKIAGPYFGGHRSEEELPTTFLGKGKYAVTSGDYRSNLIDKARNRMLLDDSLLDAVFNPIDQKLKEIYEQIKNSA